MKNFLFNTLLGFLSILLVVGCGRKVVPSTTTETRTIVRDSIIEKEVIKNVEVKVPGEKVYITEYVDCDSATNKPKAKHIKASNGRAMVELKIDSTGKAELVGGYDSLVLQIQTLIKTIERFREEKESKTKTVVKVVTEYKTRRIDIFCRCFTGIILFILLLVLFHKIKPFKFF